MKRALLLFGLITLALATPYTGCFEGGATFNQKAPGNNDTGGVNLGGYKDPNGDGRKDIAVDPNGAYVLARMGDTLVVGDLVKNKVHTVADVGIPSRVAFAAKLARFYVTVQAGHPRGVFAINAATRKVVWRHDVLDFAGAVRVFPSKDDKFLVLADQKKLRIIDAKDGRTRATLSPDNGIEDIDVLPDSSRVVVTEKFKQKRDEFETRLLFVEPVEGASTEIKVPNCSSPLVITPDGERAFLAPTQCGNQDPVSVIDLKSRRFERNLPGFGPVALSPGGQTAVAFMDRDFVDRTLFDDTSQIPSRSSDRYHLMFINTKTLKFTTVEVGDDLPRYAVSRDGKVVLVDSVWFGAKEEVRVVDPSKGTVSKVAGASVFLDHFVLSPNNKDVYLLSSDLLHHLDLAKLSVRQVTDKVTCQSLNITLDGETVLIMDWADSVHMLDARTEKVGGVLKLKAPQK